MIFAVTSIFSEKSRGLRWKAAAIAMILGTIPVIVVGAIAYSTTNQSWRQQIFRDKQAYGGQVAEKVNRFMNERHGDFFFNFTPTDFYQS